MGNSQRQEPATHDRTATQFDSHSTGPQASRCSLVKLPTVDRVRDKPLASKRLRSLTPPYARFQLFRNPFGELTDVERAQLAVIDLEGCLAHLQHPRAVLQLLGPCGHGKTTHLLAIQQAMTQFAPVATGADAVRDCQAYDCNNYVYFPEDGTQPYLPKARPLFVDEAQRLSRRRRRELFSLPGPLVFGTHVDLTPQLQRANFTVHTVDLSTPLDATRLQEVINRRILASRISNGSWSPAMEHATDPSNCTESRLSSEDSYHPLCLTSAQVVALQCRFGSNIRRIEHYLYDAFQCFAEKGGPWLPVS